MEDFLMDEAGGMYVYHFTSINGLYTSSTLILRDSWIMTEWTSDSKVVYWNEVAFRFPQLLLAPHIDLFMSSESRAV
jgi:hypothetical protein